MKALVVYYSRTGNTEKVGKALAKGLGADTEEIIDKKNRKTPLIGFIRSGYHALKEKERRIEESSTTRPHTTWSSSELRSGRVLSLLQFVHISTVTEISCLKWYSTAPLEAENLKGYINS